MSFIIDFLGFLIVKALSVLFCLMPLRFSLWAGRRIGDFAYIFNHKRCSIAYSNLKSAFPEKGNRELKKINRAHFQNIGMSAIELLKVPLLGREYFNKYVKFNNLGRVDDALGRGKGMIFLTAHLGNWEIASLGFSLFGYKLFVFAREQKYKRLNSLLNKYREMTGAKVVTKGFSVREVIKVLRSNGIVAMLADQDAGSNGEFIDFFHRPASVAKGPVAFGVKTGAAVVPALIRREGFYKHVVDIGEPLEIVPTGDNDKDIKHSLVKMTDIFEDFIRRYPEQWLWTHKRWKSSPYRTVLVLSDGKAGHLNQSLAVASMAKDALSLRLKARGIAVEPIVKIKTVEVRFKNKLTRLVLDILSFSPWMCCHWCLSCGRFCLSKESFDLVKDMYADVIVSCGASLISPNMFLSSENNAKSIVLMRPGFWRIKRFDLALLPKHDEAMTRTNVNVLVTESAPNMITETLMKSAMSQIQHPAYHAIGFLIGGDAKNFKLEKDTVSKVIRALLNASQDLDRDVVVSTSRRTSKEMDDLVKSIFSTNKRCRFLVIANEKNIEGAVPAVFGMSDVVVVSPESVSMISEAASSGKYVVVFKEHKRAIAQGRKCKYDRFIANLEEKGYIKIAGPDDVYDTIKMLLTERPEVKKLDDRERIVERLKGFI